MKFDRKYWLALFSLLILGLAIYYFRTLAGYIIIAWVISMIGAPVVTFLRKYIGKNGSALVTLSSFGMLLILLLYFVIPSLVTQAKNLTSVDYTKVVHTIEEPLNDWENWLVSKGLLKKPVKEDIQRNIKPSTNENILTRSVEIDSLITKKDSSLVNHVTVNLYVDASKLNRQESEIKNANNEGSDFFTKIKENIIYYINPQRIQSLFSATFSAFGNIVIGTLSVFFIAFFFLKEQGLFYEMIKTVVPAQYEQQMMHAIDESSKLLIRYFIGILTQTSIILVYLGLVLKILSIENALLIAFFAAITNVIPYIGPIVGFFVALIITISGNLDVGFYTDLMPQLIRLVIAFGSIQLIDNFILQPVIFSRSVKAHPLEIFFVVMIGAKLGGVTGMVLAIPFYTVFRVLGKVFLSEFKIIQKITKNL